jgi:hypothetical protein
MTRKEFEAIGKRLLPDLPGFAVKGGLLFVRPVGHTLRGILFSRSIDKRTFYVHIFIQPLFFPAEHIILNIGWRLRVRPKGPESWDADAPSLIAELSDGLRREALPFLKRIQTDRDVAEAASSVNLITGPIAHPAIAYGSVHAFNQEVIAYALARSGDLDQARDALDRLLGFPSNMEIPWHREADRRARAMKSQLGTDPAAALRQLDAWEAETTRNIGLEPFR